MKAWELIQDPKKWTQGTYARDNTGTPRLSFEREATCWCAVGAIRKCYPPEERNAIYDLLNGHVGKIPAWNDRSDHATVLAKLKELDI